MTALPLLQFQVQAVLGADLGLTKAQAEEAVGPKVDLGRFLTNLESGTDRPFHIPLLKKRHLQLQVSRRCKRGAALPVQTFHGLWATR